MKAYQQTDSQHHHAPDKATADAWRMDLANASKTIASKNGVNLHSQPVLAPPAFAGRGRLIDAAR